MPRRVRSRPEIYAEIIMTMHRWGKVTKLSKLAMAVGVPYDRLLRYLEELRKLKLVSRDDIGIYLTDHAITLVLDNPDLVGIIYDLRRRASAQRL